MQVFSYNSQTAEYALDMPAGRPAKQPRTSFGERIALARDQIGLTQQQLAEKIGTIQRVISSWEREPVALRADHLSALADALGVSTDFLLGRQNAKQRGGPIGKVRQVFERVSKLPRHQQNKVAEFVEAFVNQQTNGQKQAA